MLHEGRRVQHPLMMIGGLLLKRHDNRVEVDLQLPAWEAGLIYECRPEADIRDVHRVGRREQGWRARTGGDDLSP